MHISIFVEILKPLVKILLKIMKNQLLNKFLCNNCTLYESTNSVFVKRKINWEIALMVNFPSYISQWHANVLCISYMAQEANIWLTQTMSRYSHYWPGHLQYSHCYTEVVMWATGAQKGVRDREKRKRERQATVLAFIVPFSRPPIQYNSI